MGNTAGGHPTYVHLIVSAFKQCSKVKYIKEFFKVELDTPVLSLSGSTARTAELWELSSILSA